MPLPPEESIREVVKNCMDAWNSHDAKALASLYAKDAEFTSWMGQGATGRDAIEKYHERLFATRFKTTHQTTENIKVRLIKPDVASVDNLVEYDRCLGRFRPAPTSETRHPPAGS